MRHDKIRRLFGDYLGVGEVAIVTILAVLIFLTALVAMARSGKLLWDTWHPGVVVTDTLLVLRVLDQLLIVLMLVEILHTVRISIRFHTLLTEPFLVVGVIASIRRILVITSASREDIEDPGATRNSPRDATFEEPSASKLSRVTAIASCLRCRGVIAHFAIADSIWLLRPRSGAMIDT